MEELMTVVNEVLAKLALFKKADPHAEPSELVVDSLDQMRLLVMLEERLDVIFDDAGLKPFDLTSRTALASSIEAMFGV
jgi:acyl carrier protein